ncbi:MAG: hypothetical protein HYU66_08145 [Armatimonadetes bacterium]|nr:hypothetical protein [Armatimonadota bacterium]
MSEPGRVTLRSVVVALLLMLAVNALMRGCEFVIGRYITAGVPPVAAVAGLLLLLGVNGCLRGSLARHRFTRAELLVVYAGLCLACAATGTYGVRALFPYFSALRYYQQPTNQFERLAADLPGWYALRDVAAIKGLYEGLPGQGVPWAAWRGVLLAWGSFFGSLFLGVVCLASLVRRPWMEHDRLMFPVTQLPIALTEPGLRLWRNAWFWAGFLVSTLISATNIGHAFVEAVPAIKPNIYMPPDLSGSLRHLQPMILFNRPEIYGFAWWVPGEILFSGWFSYVAVRLFAVGGTYAGLDQPGFPFTQEQSTGGYLAMALLLAWGVRRHLRAAWCCLFRRDLDDDREPVSYRATWLGLLGSLAYCAWFLSRGGVPRWLAVGYLVVIFLFTLVYLRLRVEAGLALEFIYPYGYPRKLFIQALGSDTILVAGHGPHGLTAFYVAGFLARFHPAFAAASFNLEGMRLADQAHVRQRRMVIWLAVALVAGTVIGTINYLGYNYEEGLNYFEGRPGTADWRTATVVQEYNELNSQVLQPERTDRIRLAYTLAGAGVTLLLAAGRRAHVGFPLHPIGYLLATAYGDTSPMWWPFLTLWLLKSLLLRYGGLKLFRRVLPLFVGLIVGHYLIAGMAWSLLSASATREVAHRYYTIFG